MSSADFMIFDMDLHANQKKMLTGEGRIPTAPPPSPNSSTRRKFANLTPLPLSKLIGCCEELVAKKENNALNICKSKPLSMKRKTSDSDESCSTSSSAGTSPGGPTTDYSCSFGKRSRSSLESGSNSFRRLDFSMSELRAAINSSDGDDMAMEL